MEPANRVPVLTPKPVFVTKGLDGQDENIDKLEKYFNEMKQVTVEPACGDLDLLTFAACTVWFGVIAIRGKGDYNIKTEAKEAETLGASASSDVEAYRHPLLDEDVSSLTTEEVDRYWEEAFLEQMEENEIRDEKFVTGNLRAIIGRNTPDPDDLHILESPPMTALPPSSQYDFYIPEAPPETPEPLPSDEAYEEMFNMADISDESQEIEVPERSSREAQGSPQYLNIRPLGRVFFQQAPRRMSSIIIPPPDDDPSVLEERQQVAENIRDELRRERVTEYQKKLRIRAGLERTEPPPAPKPTHKAPPAPVPRIPSPEPFLGFDSSQERYNPIGLIYLSASQNFDDPLHLGEYTLGFYVDPEHRHRPNLSTALETVAAVAFRDHGCHRVQSIIVDNPEKYYSLQILASAGFSQEGMRRRAFYSSFGHEYRDVHYFAMLAMEWSYDLNSTTRIKPRSLWEEVLGRHRREQEEILKMEDRSLKRTHSMETIRNPTSLSAVAQDLLETETTNSPSKRRKLASAALEQLRSVTGASSIDASSSSSIRDDASDTGDETDWSLISSLDRCSLPSAPGTSYLGDTDGYMSSASDTSFLNRSDMY